MTADARKLPVQEVRKLIDRGIFSAAEAREAGLVDELMYRPDFRKMIQRRYGAGVKIEKHYGKDEALDLDLSNPFALFQKMFGQVMESAGKGGGKPGIAVVYVDSMITSGKTEDSPFGGRSNSGSDTVAGAIDKAHRDDGIKAVVLRVDSPGGSALASEVICEAVKRCKKDKPVIVSMGDVAASGGYYVSCEADTIFAQPGTITGSIGVLGGKIVTKGLWDWVGITGHEYKRGARADLFNTNRPFSDEERTVVKDLMLRVYGEFKERVTAGRGEKIKGDLEKLAGGRVYTGREALEIGLVDRLGGLADAVKFAKEQAEIEKFELRVLPAPKSLGDVLKELMGRGDEDEGQLRARYGARWLNSPAIQSALPLIEQADPPRAAAVRRFLAQLDLLARERVTAVDPSIPMIR